VTETFKSIQELSPLTSLRSRLQGEIRRGERDLLTEEERLKSLDARLLARRLELNNARHRHDKREVARLSQSVRDLSANRARSSASVASARRALTALHTELNDVAGSVDNSRNALAAALVASKSPWTIHGLWPTTTVVRAFPACPALYPTAFCFSKHSVMLSRFHLSDYLISSLSSLSAQPTSNERLDPKALARALPRMRTLWPSCFSQRPGRGHDDEGFWLHEWSKHGRYSHGYGSKPVSSHAYAHAGASSLPQPQALWYFNHTLKLAETLANECDDALTRLAAETAASPAHTDMHLETHTDSVTSTRAGAGAGTGRAATGASKRWVEISPRNGECRLRLRWDKNAGEYVPQK
jgi:ribonuclease I